MGEIPSGGSHLSYLNMSLRIFIMALPLLAVGCGKDAACFKQVGYEDIPADAVLVRVDGTMVLTKAEAEGIAAVRLAMATGGRKISERMLEISRQRFIRQAILQFPAHAVLLAEAKRLGVVVDERELADYHHQLIKKFSAAKTFGKGWKDTRAWAAAHKVDFDVFERMLRDDLLEIGLKRKWYADRPAVTEGEIDALVVRIEALDRDIAHSNEMAYVSCTNVWKELKSGADFADVCKRRSQDVPPLFEACDWGEFTPSEMQENKELLAMVSALPPGGVTSPVEVEDGVAVVRFDGMFDVSRPEGQVRAYGLSRIFFRLLPRQQAASRDRLRATLERKWEARRFSEALSALKAAARVEYPYGTNHFAKALMPTSGEVLRGEGGRK